MKDNVIRAKTKYSTLSVFVGLSLLASAAVAGTQGEAGHDASNTGDAVKSLNIGVDQVVDGRRAAFWLSAATLAATMKEAKTGADAQNLMFGARVLNNWSRALPGMFPDGSVNESSKALPGVWQDRDGFERAAAAYQAETAHLVELAKAGDTEAFGAKIAVLHKTCAACHDQYRKKRPGQ